MDGEESEKGAERGKAGILRFPDRRRGTARFGIALSLHGRGSVLRLWRRPADARRARTVFTDARPSPSAPDPDAPDAPTLTRRLWVLRGAIAGGLALVFTAGVLVAVFGSRGVLDGRRAARELDDWRHRTEEQHRRVVELRRRVQRLREDPMAIERIAREELGFVKPGEITFLLPREAGTGASTP